MTPQTLRSTLRWAHLALSLLLGAYLYSPLHGEPLAADLLRWLVVPAIVATGLAMWKQGPLLRLLRPNAAR